MVTIIRLFTLSLLCAGSSLVAVSGGYSSWWCAVFIEWWFLLLWSRGSRHANLHSCSLWAQQLWLMGSGAWAQ